MFIEKRHIHPLQYRQMPNAHDISFSLIFFETNVLIYRRVFKEYINRFDINIKDFQTWYGFQSQEHKPYTKYEGSEQRQQHGSDTLRLVE